MSGGYTASSDAMQTASKKIGDLAKDLPDKNADMQHTPVTGDGFGRAHTKHGAAYTKAVDTLWAALTGYGTTLSTYGQKVASAGSSYVDTDNTQGGTIGTVGEL